MSICPCSIISLRLLFVVERIENPVNSNCAVQQPSVYLFTSIYEYAVKFCFYDDHAPLSAIYVRT